jgi:ABC-type multidrug transport system ATPase subunit
MNTEDKDIELGPMPVKTAIDEPRSAAAPHVPSSILSNTKSLRFQDTKIKETTLVWNKLTKYVDIGDGKKRQIMFDVSGCAKPGELIALMGPSGSGKTTLLNILGGRALSQVNGEVYVNNIKYKKSMKRTIAYVLQEDIFYQHLTVRQQLYFTSTLRLPDSLSKESKQEAVDFVIKTLRIERCADTKIMLVSGGEKKRCNIGTELLTSPSVLLLDGRSIKFNLFIFILVCLSGFFHV